MTSTLLTGLMLFTMTVSAGAGAKDSKVYRHEQALFSVTCPSDWVLSTQDEVIFEFSQNDVRIKFGGVQLDSTAAGLKNLSEDEFRQELEIFSKDYFGSYCKEYAVRLWRTDENVHTTWNGLGAYRSRKHAFYIPIKKDVVVDLMVAVDKVNLRLYIFVVFTPMDYYDANKSEIESFLASFKPE